MEAGQNLELEDFLEPIQDVKDGKAYLNAIHFKDNIDPSDAASTEEVTLSKDYDRKDLDIFERDPSKATMMKDEPFFGYQGIPFISKLKAFASEIISEITGTDIDMKSDTDESATVETDLENNRSEDSAVGNTENEISEEISSDTSLSSDENNDVDEPIDDEKAEMTDTVTEEAERFEGPEYVDGVRFSTETATFANAGSQEENVIQNFIFWDGSLVDEDGSPIDIEWQDGERYVIVFQPINEKNAIFNTFLAFEVTTSLNENDLFLNPDEYPGLYFEYPGDPVDLLTGSFTWEYTDFSLYGMKDMPFTRYYESTTSDNDCGIGNGWSTNYSYSLDVDLLYAELSMPHGRHVYFSMMPDGTYRTKAGSEYSMQSDNDGYRIEDGGGTVYLFSRDENRISKRLRI